MTAPLPDPSADTTDATLHEGLVHGQEQLARAVAALVHLARHDVRLFAPHLDPAVFNTVPVAHAAAKFAARHPRNRARLLVEDAARVRRGSIRLIELARRLADNLELREVEEDDRGACDLYLIADRSAYLLQEDIGKKDALVAARAPHETMKLIERFDAAWQRATPVALRTLGL